MGVVDYREATEYVLKRFGLCRGCNYRNIVLILLTVSFGLNIASWVTMSGNTLAVMANCVFLLAVLVGLAGVAVFDYVALMATAIFMLIASICAIVTAVCLSTDSTDPAKIGSTLDIKRTIAFLSTIAAVETIFTVFLFNLLRSVKMYATSGSIYMNFMDDDDYMNF